jgi:hypothetical protein
MALTVSLAAQLGGQKLLAYFINAAAACGRRFVAGPVWNLNDELIAGDTQQLRYTFVGSAEATYAFNTATLKKFGVGDKLTESAVAKSLYALMKP